MAGPARWKFLTALWTIYLVWGSTYFAIKISVRTLPAFFSAGTRFLLAGALLALILAMTGRSMRVSRRELLSSALLGISLLGLGVGGVTLAETRIDSLTALSARVRSIWRRSSVSSRTWTGSARNPRAEMRSS